MPVYWNRTAQIAVAFFLGLAMDFFISTPGIHASACLWMVLIRFGLLQTLDTSQLLMDKKLFSTYTVGNVPFFRVASVLVLFYHLYIFLLENIGNFNLTNYLLTVIVSSMFAFLIVALIQLVFYRDFNVTR
jgi:hypothetical protein